MTTKVTPQLLDATTIALIRDSNRIINGDMRIDVRQNGSSVVATLDSGATFSVGSGSAGTPQLQSGNGEAGLMRNSAGNWTANQSMSLTGGFSAEIA